MFNLVTMTQEGDNSNYYNLVKEQKQSRPRIRQTTRHTHIRVLQVMFSGTWRKHREVAMFDCRQITLSLWKVLVRSRNLRKRKYLSTPSKKFAITVNLMGRRNFTPHNTPRERVRTASKAAIYVLMCDGQSCQLD